MSSYFSHSLLPDDAVARYIAVLSLSLSPSGNFTQDGEKSWFSVAHLDPPPGFFWRVFIGRRIGEYFHFFVDPASSAIVF